MKFSFSSIRKWHYCQETFQIEWTNFISWYSPIEKRNQKILNFEWVLGKKILFHIDSSVHFQNRMLHTKSHFDTIVWPNEVEYCMLL